MTIESPYSAIEYPRKTWYNIEHSESLQNLTQCLVVIVFMVTMLGYWIYQFSFSLSLTEIRNGVSVRACDYYTHVSRACVTDGLTVRIM